MTKLHKYSWNVSRTGSKERRERGWIRLIQPHFLCYNMVMISTTHITTGAAVGLAVGSIMPNSIWAIIIAFLLGVLSHHILDQIPHTDAGSFRKPDDKEMLRSGERTFALLDNVLGTAIVLYLFFTQEPSWPMLFAAAGGNFPDIFHHPNWWANVTRSLFNGKYFKFHEKYHFTARGNLILLGIITNLVLIIGSVWYIVTAS